MTYDWRHLSKKVTTDKPAAVPDRRARAAEDAVQREVRRRYAQGQRPRDIALALGLNDNAVKVMLYGTDTARGEDGDA